MESRFDAVEVLVLPEHPPHTRNALSNETALYHLELQLSQSTYQHERPGYPASVRWGPGSGLSIKAQHKTETEMKGEGIMVSEKTGR